MTVIFEVPAFTTDVGLKVTVTPVGFVDVSDTVPANPLRAEIDTVKVAARPRATETDDGAALILKSDRAVTTSVIGAECTSVPLVPTTDSGYVPEAAEELPRRFPNDAQEAYQAASLLTRLSTLAKDDKKLPMAQALSEQYAARAVQLLQKAIARDMRSREQAEKDPAFTGLRTREDYKKAIGEANK